MPTPRTSTPCAGCDPTPTPSRAPRRHHLVRHPKYYLATPSERLAPAPQPRRAGYKPRPYEKIASTLLSEHRSGTVSAAHHRRNTASISSFRDWSYRRTYSERPGESRAALCIPDTTSTLRAGSWRRRRGCPRRLRGLLLRFRRLDHLLVELEGGRVPAGGPRRGHLRLRDGVRDHGRCGMAGSPGHAEDRPRAEHPAGPGHRRRRVRQARRRCSRRPVRCIRSTTSSPPMSRGRRSPI